MPPIDEAGAGRHPDVHAGDVGGRVVVRVDDLLGRDQEDVVVASTRSCRRGSSRSAPGTGRRAWPIQPFVRTSMWPAPSRSVPVPWISVMPRMLIRWSAAKFAAVDGRDDDVPARRQARQRRVARAVEAAEVVGAGDRACCPCRRRRPARFSARARALEGAVVRARVGGACRRQRPLSTHAACGAAARTGCDARLQQQVDAFAAGERRASIESTVVVAATKRFVSRGLSR